MEKLTDNSYPLLTQNLSVEAREWWSHHKEMDAERQREEAAEKHHRTRYNDILKQLSPKDREYLGLELLEEETDDTDDQ